ncbi:ead/Ea22-like family protein [Citrobacter braakii]|uniref:ead/Ea22-like family protein n=1 Tax=Citrobacter braakii TaxID=57706 RepID=UPI0034E49088
MTALNKQALRQLATDAHELGIIKRYTKGIEANKRFVAIATPLTVLALLDENESMARDLISRDGEIEGLRQRVAELEARTVQLPPTFWYEHDDLSRDIPVLDKRLVKKALRAAGIGVKGE